MNWMEGVFRAFVFIILRLKILFRWIYIIIKTLPRDICVLILYIKIKSWTKRCVEENQTIPKMFSIQSRKHPNKVAFRLENDSWTFKKVEEFSNRIANYFDGEGYQTGDVVALLLENCCAYPGIWMGLSKCGIITALINTNLVKASLLHSIKTANCKAMIFGSAHVRTLKDVMNELHDIKLYQFCIDPNEEREPLFEAVDLQRGIGNVSPTQLMVRELSYQDQVLFIYTSGTTGLPKACILTHFRLLTIITTFALLTKASPNDVVYSPLPLYHGASGIGGVGLALLRGLTVVLRKKFSATHYFNDCIAYNVTVGQYIGEICRYLMAATSPGIKTHKVRLLIGIGLKPRMWKQFIEKFGIKQILELYGSTEGIASMVNIDGKIGAIGSFPPYLKGIFPVTNVKCEETTGQPIRNQHGYCVECGTGEPGILVAKINPKNIMLKYYGYTDKKASEGNILRNVFRTGDKYFNSGDMAVYDEFGYFYFVDRIGDTFRWKGENVSTTEVEAIISNAIQFNDVAVYGVEISNCEGRAGMAAIVDPNKTLDITTFGSILRKELPSYANPIFLRIMESLPITETFKLKKKDLQKEGFNVYIIKDNLYFYDSLLRKYVPLTKEIFEKIEGGKIRL